MALAERSVLLSPGAFTPELQLNRPVLATRMPPRVRGRQADGSAATYWEWSKTNAPKFARPGRRPVPKGKARFLPGRDGTPMGRHVTRHDLQQELATDTHARRLGFQLPAQRRPATADMAKKGSLFLPGQRAVQKRRSPSKRDRAQAPDGIDGGQLSRSESRLTDYSLDYLVPDISFNGSRSELLPPSAPFSFMTPSGPLERERARPHSTGTHEPTDGIYDLPRWPAFQLGGLEASGTYAPPERSGQEPTRPPSRERLEGLAKAMRGPKGMHEIQAAKHDAQLSDELKAKSIHKDKKPLSQERLVNFAKPLPHKQGAKYVKPAQVSKWKPRKRKQRPQQQQQEKKEEKEKEEQVDTTASTDDAEQRVLEVKTVDGMELTQVVTKTKASIPEGVDQPVSRDAKATRTTTSYPDREMTAVSTKHNRTPAAND